MTNTISSSPIVINCTFTYNHAEEWGGGMFNDNACYPTVINCVFANNSSNGYGGGVCNLASLSTLANCILWDNSPEQIDDTESWPTVVDYSDVQDGWPGTGNIDADPLFVDAAGGDVRLSPGSPCIDAGYNSWLPLDSDDLDSDGKLCELIPIDLDGNGRFADDPATMDSGCGLPVIVDMGAYEFPGDEAELIYADINGDGTVDVLDLLFLLTGWGECGDCCLGDLDLNGQVEVLDLLEVLGAWGSCP